MKRGWRGIIREYRRFLPVSRKTPIVTLLEGNTPLLKAEKLAQHLGFGGAIYLKLEGLNPTGSFKDRGMTMAVSKAVEAGSQAIICASTGNTSASAAAYGAKAGLPVIVLVPAKGIALGKLAQALMYGAKVVPIGGTFDDCLAAVRRLLEKYPTIALMNSINPHRLEGQKTAAFEICEKLGRAPDYHFIPVGNAGNITAYYTGYLEYYFHKQQKELRDYILFSPPKMMGFQAAGAAPIVLGHVVENPQTVASAIRIGRPARWKEAEEAVRVSHGKIDAVTDEEILDAYRLLARLEGIFAEPASAVSVAGLIKMLRANVLEEAEAVVCTLTGNGLKDPDTALGILQVPPTVPPDLSAIEKAIWG